MSERNVMPVTIAKSDLKTSMVVEMYEERQRLIQELEDTKRTLAMVLIVTGQVFIPRFDMLNFDAEHTDIIEERAPDRPGFLYRAEVWTPKSG